MPFDCRCLRSRLSKRLSENRGDSHLFFRLVMPSNNNIVFFLSKLVFKESEVVCWLFHLKNVYSRKKYLAGRTFKGCFCYKLLNTNLHDSKSIKKTETNRMNRTKSIMQKSN
jgi:hypothetical protein